MLKRIPRSAWPGPPAIAVVLASAFGGLFGCAGRDTGPPPVVQRETPADEILRVGKRWQSTVEARGFRSPPNSISLFDTALKSTLFLSQATQTEERFEATETFQTADGTRFQCAAQGKLQVTLRFGRRNQEAVLELTRPALKLGRTCKPNGFPEPELEMPSSKARFALRGDQLVAIDPPSERRIYLPIE